MNWDIRTIVEQAPYFMMVFIRLAAFMVFIPFFQNSNFIILIKVGFAFLVSLLLYPTLSLSHWVIPSNIPGFILAAGQEILVGILMSLTFLILLMGLQLAGRLVNYQSAFAMAQGMDPTIAGTGSNALTVFLVMVGTLLVIAIGGDHYLLYSMGKSFEMVEPGSIAVSRSLISEMSALLLKSFEMGFRLAAPAVLLLLCIDVILGVIGRTFTRMQIYFVGLPLRIAVGLFGISLSLGFILAIWGKEVPNIPRYMMSFLKLLRL